MADRLHPQDMRTVVAAILTAGEWCRENVIIRTDALLADLEATAKREEFTNEELDNKIKELLNGAAWDERERIIKVLLRPDSLEIFHNWDSLGSHVENAIREVLRPRP